MPINLPAYDVQRLSIGPSVIYFGTAGAAPTTDFGAIMSAELKVTMETTKFMIGMPSVAQWYRPKSIDVTLSVKGLEWNLEKLQKALGGYYTTQTQGNIQTQTLWGNFEYSDPLSLKLVHTMVSGGTLTVDIFEACPGGADTFAFASAVHEMPYVFKAIATTLDWEGNALPPNTPFRITLQTPTT